METTLPPQTFAQRFRKFLARPMRSKLDSVTFRAQNIFKKPETMFLPSGLRWMTQRSHLDEALQERTFETGEMRFVERYLRPGMVVMDIGAHHGLYSLMAAKRIGNSGKVVAFEPSHHERKVLKSHIRMNKCRNIRVEPFAVGGKAEEAAFYQVEGLENYCNSLRPPAVSSSTRTVKVQVLPLDDYLRKRKIKTVDFIKIDTEGAELEVLKGAARTLTARPRPIVLIEVAEIRTAPWGYPARLILEHLKDLDYEWYAINADGDLSIAIDPDIHDANLVAVPVERVAEVTGRLTS